METFLFLPDFRPRELERYLRPRLAEEELVRLLPSPIESWHTGADKGEWVRALEGALEQATICIAVSPSTSAWSAVPGVRGRVLAVAEGRRLPIIVVGDPREFPERVVGAQFGDTWHPVIAGGPEEIFKALLGLRRKYEYQTDSALIESPEFQISIATLSETIALELQKNPEAIRNLTPRQFEELVAELMEKSGYEVELTQKARDGGVDIYAVKKDAFGKFLTIVDCKKYRADRTIGIEFVRQMVGTMQIEDASHAMVASTSSFSSVAKGFEAEHKYKISLKDHSDIVNWTRGI